MDIMENSFEMDIALLTPVKFLEMDVISPDIMKGELTPLSMEDTDDKAPSSVKYNLPPPSMIDEDSGLGMTPLVTTCRDLLRDDSENKIKTCKTGGAKRSLFGHKRCFEGDIDGSITKRHRRQNGSRIRNRKCPLKKSLSFGNDAPSSASEQMTAVDRLSEDNEVIGNGSQTFTLPTIPGRHSDLKSITPDTMADILIGRYDDVIRRNYRIIDCRYPYEFQGGHIKGAENIYTHGGILELLRKNSNRQEILIFHCEFSSERGPKMSRFLRSQDRDLNCERYPFLHFPEIYLLHNGYKAFFESHKELCEPMSYTPMHHSNHTSELRHFRAKSKSWSANDMRHHKSIRMCF